MRLAGESAIAPGGNPLPLRFAITAPPAMLPGSENIAAGRVPVPLGWNNTAMVQVAFGASEGGQLLPATWYSAVLTDGAPSVTATPPVLVTVRFCVADADPCTVSGKESEPGVSVAAGGAAPWPLNGTEAGELPKLPLKTAEPV